MSKYKKSSITIPTKDGNMKVLVLDHHDQKKKVPGVLWIHGGGYITGMASLVYFMRGKDFVNLQEAVVFSPEYRLAPKHPYPAALNDCYACLEYMYDHQEELGIDRIIVGGESAGGGLAIAISMLARDQGKIPIDYSIPLYPMIDCLETSTNVNNHAKAWDSKKNDDAWKKYLGEDYKTREISYYASPARCKDYSNLPKCYTFVCDGEPFFQETKDYIQHLKDENIKAEVDIYHANQHAFDFFPFSDASRQARKRFHEKIDEIFKEIYE